MWTGSVAYEHLRRTDAIDPTSRRDFVYDHAPFLLHGLLFMNGLSAMKVTSVPDGCRTSSRLNVPLDRVLIHVRVSYTVLSIRT